MTYVVPLYCSFEIKPTSKRMNLVSIPYAQRDIFLFTSGYCIITLRQTWRKRVNECRGLEEVGGNDGEN
jgi:hypothetical protein